VISAEPRSSSWRSANSCSRSEKRSVVIDLDDPIALLLATVTELTKAGLEHAVYGGLALAMYGEPRETKDADVAVAHVSLAAAQAALSRIGATVVPAFDSVPFGGLRISQLSLGAGKLNTVDLVTPTSPGYAARVLRGRLEGQELRVVSPEDFVVLKILSTASTTCKTRGAS